MKKHSILTLIILLTAISLGDLYSQKGSSSKIVTIESMRITKKAAKRYLDSKRKLVGLSVNSNGMVKPDSGYKMARTDDKGWYFLGKKDSKFTTKTTPGFDIIVVLGEEVYCMCSDWADDCNWQAGSSPDKPSEITMYCDGGCTCGIKWEHETLWGDNEIIDELGPGL